MNQFKKSLSMEQVEEVSGMGQAFRKQAPPPSSSSSSSSSSSQPLCELMQTLRNAEKRGRFLEFLVESHCGEVLLAWEAMETYRIRFPDRTYQGAAAQALQIINRFVRQDAPEEVNLEDKHRQPILIAYEEERLKEGIVALVDWHAPFQLISCIPDTFTDLQQHLFQILKTDSFPKFEKWLAAGAAERFASPPSVVAKVYSFPTHP
jgi:hypothetical protein